MRYKLSPFFTTYTTLFVVAGLSGCGLDDGAGFGIGVGSGFGSGDGVGLGSGVGAVATSPVSFNPYSAKPSLSVPIKDIAGFASTSSFASGDEANTTSRSFSAAAVTPAEGLIGASDQLPSAAGFIVLFSRI